MLSIIIVNYKTPELTLRCIKSIVETMQSPYELIIVDNNSQDHSQSLICLEYPIVIWINNPENSGFGRGNNLGASFARGNTLLFLNSDMFLVPETIEYCLKLLNENKQIGVLGCLLRNVDGSIQKSTYNYTGDFLAVLKKSIPLEYIFRFKTPPLKAVMGAYMMIPKLVFDKVNGFDTDFFMYAEELELCHRIHKLGYSIIYTEKVEAIHKHGGSSDGSTWSNYQNYLSNALLYLKIRGLWGYFWYHVVSVFTFTSNLLVLWKMDKAFRANFWKETNYYFSNFGAYCMIPFKYSKRQNSGATFLRKY